MDTFSVPARPKEMADTGPDPAGFWLGLCKAPYQPDHVPDLSVHLRGQYLRKQMAIGTTSVSCWEWRQHSVAEQAEVAPQLRECVVGGVVSVVYDVAEDLIKPWPNASSESQPDPPSAQRRNGCAPVVSPHTTPAIHLLLQECGAHC